MKYRAAKYYAVIIPPEIMGDARLFWQDKLVYGLYMGTRLADGCSRMTTWDICHCLDLSDKKVWGAVARLNKHKLVKRTLERTYGRTRYFKTEPLITSLKPTEVEMSAFDPLLDDKNFDYTRDLEAYTLATLDK